MCVWISHLVSHDSVQAVFCRFVGRGVDGGDGDGGGQVGGQAVVQALRAAALGDQLPENLREVATASARPQLCLNENLHCIQWVKEDAHLRGRKFEFEEKRKEEERKKKAKSVAVAGFVSAPRVFVDRSWWM